MGIEQPVADYLGNPTAMLRICRPRLDPFGREDGINDLVYAMNLYVDEVRFASRPIGRVAVAELGADFPEHRVTALFERSKQGACHGSRNDTDASRLAGGRHV